MYSLSSFRPKASNRSRSRHRLASEVDGHSGTGRKPSLDSHKNTTENIPNLKTTYTGYVNSPKDIAAFHKHKIPLQIIIKDLSLPAPPSIRPSLQYIYGDLTVQAYLPSNKKVPYIVEEGRRRGRSALRHNIQKFLRADRNALKSEVTLAFAQLLDDCDTEDEMDLIRLFACRYSKTLLPADLAKAILYKQSVDEQWRASMQASQDSASGVIPRAKYLGGFHSKTFYIRPGPSALGNEVFVAAAAAANDDIAAVSLHGRSESESSAGSISSGETLVDTEAAQKFNARLMECEKKDGIVVRNVKVRSAIAVAGSAIMAQSATVEYIVAEETHSEMGVKAVHALTPPKDVGSHHPLTRTAPRRPRKRSARA